MKNRVGRTRGLAFRLGTSNGEPDRETKGDEYDQRSECEEIPIFRTCAEYYAYRIGRSAREPMPSRELRTFAMMDRFSNGFLKGV